MPKYRIHLANGKSLVLEGDTAPTDADIEAAADEAGVRTLLMSSGERSLDSANTSPSRPSPSVAGAVVGGGMAAAPAVARGLNAVAAPIARGAAPAATALVVANDLRQGNIRQAAYDAAAGSVASGAAAKVAPKIAGAVQRATAPASVRPSAILDAGGRAMGASVPGGVVTRVANAISRFAGPAGVAVDAIFGEGREGHRPIGETPATTAARQSDFAQQFKDMVNREAGREVITGNTTEEIIASIARYRASR